MRKSFALSVALCFAVTFACAVCFTACAVGEAEVNYILSEDGTHYILSEVTGDKRGLTEYEIPSVYAAEGGQALPVTEIADEAFWECTRLVSVTIPQGVKKIGDRAFGKTSLRECVLPDTLESIGFGAFGMCDGLREITVPASVTSLGDLAFFSCTHLKVARVEASVETLGDRVFYNTVITQGNNTFYSTELTTVYLSTAIKKINVTALQGNVITDIYYAGTEEQWADVCFFAMVDKKPEDGKDENDEKVKVEEKQDKAELLKGITMHFERAE